MPQREIIELSKIKEVYQSIISLLVCLYQISLAMPTRSGMPWNLKLYSAIENCTIHCHSISMKMSHKWMYIPESRTGLESSGGE